MRTKRGNVAKNRRKKVLKRTKGFRGSLSKLYRPAHQAYLHALSNAYRDRRRKKRDFRNLWITRISGMLTQYGISYSVFMGGLLRNNIQLNRKMLSEIAIYHKSAFETIVEASKSSKKG